MPPRSALGPHVLRSARCWAAVSADSLVLEDNFRAGDVIYAINKEVTPTVSRLREILRKLESGASIALQIERDGRLRFISFELP